MKHYLHNPDRKLPGLSRQSPIKVVNARRDNRIVTLICVIVFTALATFTLSFAVSCSGTPSITSAASSSTPASEVVETTPADALNLIQSNLTSADFVVLDVRTAAEFNTGHIEGAINMDYSARDFSDQLSGLDRNKRYLVYCRTGIRSAQATRIMAELGFHNIRDLAGGIMAWINAGYAVVK